MSTQSVDGLTILNPNALLVLRALGASSNTAPSAESPVAGFGAARQIALELSVTSLTLTGGAAPTAKLQVWVQRRLPSGDWDDLLAFETAAWAGALAATVRYAGEYSARHGSVGAPAALQDGGGSPPFAQRGAWCSDEMRVKHRIVTTGTPTAASVTWELNAWARW